MRSRILRITLVCLMIGSISGSLPRQQSFAATADDYFIYSRFDPPGVGDITAAGGYVKYTGIPDVWGDEIQYVYFLSGNTGYKVKIWVTDGDGDGTIDPRQHPDHYLSGYVGPIEPRHFEIVSSADLTGYTAGSGSHSEEFYIDSSGVYLGAYPNGIHKWDHDWNYLGKIANPPPVRTESMAYNPAENVWYAGGRYRNIYELRDVDNDGSFLDETWSVIFSYPSYSGDHHDGMEYVAGYLWISDMTSDVIGKWQYDSSSDSWIEVEHYTYTETGDVEGMGFGPNDHFWVASGPYSAAYIYELGNEITQGYPVAEAGPDVGNHAPTVPITLNGSGSHHTDPSKQIVLYEWDFEGDGIWDYTGTDPIVEHTYPAYYNPDGSIDWDNTAKDYPATLRVTDNSDPPLQDTDTRIVHITSPPWKPVADPGGPYEGVNGAPVQLDGSESYDPESKMVAPGHPWYETIAEYEWDLDYDGEFDDSTDVKPSWTWESEGIYIVSLRVTDSQPSGPGGTVGPLDVDVKHATVVITKQKPPTTKIETHAIDSANGTAKFTWSGSDDSTPPAQLVYEHRLLNPDSPLYDWSDWSSSTTATYPRPPDSRLPDGTYRFQVKAKDADGAIQPDSATWEFTIGEGVLNCVIHLRPQGIEASIGVIGDFEPFDIYVGASTGDIKQVRFSSDEALDEIAVGDWTEWYNWNSNALFSPWNATAKTMSWSFTTGGNKEVWAEVEDAKGSVDQGYAYILVEIPEWREVLRVGDILYDPCSLKGIGHAGIYVGNGEVMDPTYDGLKQSITTWDFPNRDFVQILRVVCPDANPNCAQEAVGWALGLYEKIYQDDPDIRTYSYQCPLPNEGWCGVVCTGDYRICSITKNASDQEDDWYCSEVVWAAYFNAHVNIENDKDCDWEILEYDNIIRPHEICDNSPDDVYPVSGHNHGEVIYPVKGKCGCSFNLKITADCPVDLIITDPDGLTIDKDSSEIPGAIYWSDDLDGDGSLDVVIDLERKEGTYQIQVKPRPEAELTDTYTLIFKDYGTGQEVVLAYETLIKNIPDEPYEIEIAGTGVPPAVNQSPEISVLAPVASQTIIITSYQIQWQATDPDNSASSLSIDLFYSTDDGSTWTSISSDETNDGVYDWDISLLQGGEYWLKLVAEDPDGRTSEATTGPFTIVTLTGNIIVAPNPVTSAGAVFFYTLPDGTSTAKLMVLNVAGRLLFETSLDVDSTRFPSAGTWNPTDQNGVALANGPYIYVLIADGKVIGQGKMVIQR